MADEPGTLSAALGAIASGLGGAANVAMTSEAAATATFRPTATNVAE